MSLRTYPPLRTRLYFTTNDILFQIFLKISLEREP